MQSGHHRQVQVHGQQCHTDQIILQHWWHGLLVLNQDKIEVSYIRNATVGKECPRTALSSENRLAYTVAWAASHL